MNTSTKVWICAAIAGGLVTVSLLAVAGYFWFKYVYMLGDFSQSVDYADPVEHASRALPTSGVARTSSDMAQMALAFNRRMFVETYEKIGHKDERWDADAVSLLEDASAYYAKTDPFRDPAALRDRARSILDRGCDDPLIQYLCGAFEQGLGNDAAAAPLLEQSAEAFRDAKYPRVRARFAALRLSRLYWKDSYRKEKEYKQALEDVVKYTAESMRTGDYLAGEERLVILHFADAWEDMTTEQEEPLCRAIMTTPGISPWISKTVEGYLEIDLAWRSRGSGWASEVTEKGWKGFREHLDKARAALTAAWELRPDCPEAPAEMITVCMGGGTDEEVREWFDHAVEAQFDYLPAYDKYIWALRPRWGGSHQAMYDFGLACLDTGRFDTDVPYQFFYVLETISGDMKSDQSLINLPATYKRLEEMFEGYLGVKTGSALAFYKTLYAATAWKHSQYADAARLFDELGDGVQAWVVAEHVEAGLADVRGESKLRAGPLGSEFARVETLAEKGSWGDALALCTSLESQVEAGSEVAAYLAMHRQKVEHERAFFSGEPVALLPDASFSGWSVKGGTWRLGDDGWIEGTSNDAGLELVYDKPIEGDFQCEATFVYGTSPYKFKFNGGFVFGYGDEHPEEFYSCLVYRAEEIAYVRSRFSTNDGVSARASVAPDENRLEMSCVKGRVTVKVNGSEILKNEAVENNYLRDGVRVGIGGYYWYPNATLRFKDFKIRRL
ncbi:MAG TPA: hypothetical protein VIH35_09630 [Kiritimatiellia bacterium]|jgi:hypothetical protein